MRNRFTNPANGVFYDWEINHTDEQESGHTRNITRTAPTGNVGLVKQQGEDGPYILRYTGTILTRAQWRAMWAWYNLSRTQTIWFRDFDNQQYEVQITALQTLRKRKLRSPGRDASMMDSYWTYTIEMEVYRFLAGDALVAGVTA